MKIKVVKAETKAGKKWYIDFGDRVRPATTEEVALWQALVDKTSLPEREALEIEVEYESLNV